MTAAITTELRVRPAPALEPPYDDESVAHRPGTPGNTAGQPLLPCFGATQRGIVTGENTPTPSPAYTETRFGRQKTVASQLPEARNHARKLVQALMEMISGARPLGQLVPWLHETLYFELAQRYGAVREANRRAAATGTTAQSTGPRTRVGSVHTCEPADGVCEISAVVHDRGHSYAVALRMEGLDGSWRCTEFTVV